jgi:hypothetical protein
MRKTTILGIVALLAVLAMPTALASEYYLVLDNSSVANPGDCTTVSVWMNATQGVQSGLFNITFDAGCAKVTSFTYNNTCFIDPVTTAIVPGRLTVGISNSPSGPVNSLCTPGQVHLGDFEICCNTTTPPCQTDLEFNTGTGMWDQTLSPVPFTVDNGTFTCGTPIGDVDLNVTDIDVNPGNTSVGDAIFVNQINQINATVYNAGPDDIIGDFDVCFYNNSVEIGTETVNGLAAGASITVYTYWTPSCDDYPGLSGDYLAVRVPTTLSVTADCGVAISETDELNNTLSLNTEVSASGYKSKNFDCDPADPLTPFKYAGDLFTGGLVYNVSGFKTCASTGYPTDDFAPGNTTTRVHHIDLPSDATVKDARLYIVWYDDFGNPSPGFLANLSVDFTGPCGSATSLTMDDMYTDSKAYGLSYNVPRGKYAYNVTSLVCDTESNNYTVTVENIDPVNPTVLLGGILVVVYEGGDETIQLWWQEGCDLLSGRTKYGSSTTGATATVAFPGSINLASLDSAELITFVDQGMTLGSNMLFNGINIKTDAWENESYPNSKINVEEVDVKSNLLASGNNMGFQDTGTSGMQANLAILVTKIGSVAIGIDQPEFVDPQSQFTINITVNPFGLPVSAVQYDLYYNTSVVWAEWANPGTFLSQDGATTDVTVLSIDNLWDVAGHTGKITYAETTYESGTGTLPAVSTAGVLTTIHFSAIGVRGTYTQMDLDDVLMSNSEKDPVDSEVTDCCVTIYDNQDPVANGSSMYRFSNVASKFQCFAVLCPCLSTAGNDTWWGNNITYVRWDFGDGEYGTSEGVDPCEVKEHEYTTWNWNGTGYDPFTAYLTVRDDGEPQLSNTTEVYVQVYIAGDTNGDGVVDIFDAACVGRHWGQGAESPEGENCTYYWTNPQKDEADLNNDNHVNTIDAMIVGTNWNHLAYAPYIKE